MIDTSGVVAPVNVANAAPQHASASGQHTRAAIAAAPMRPVLHVSDPHFGVERSEVVEALLRFAAAQQPSLVVVSGDITQRARAAQFDRARLFCDRLSAPKLIVPGNHDMPLFNLLARFTRPFAGYERVFGSDLEPVYSDAHVLAIGVNTVRATLHERGAISRAQVERVASVLRMAEPQQLRLVVTHQPMHVMPGVNEAALLIGRDRAAKNWSDAGADLVLGGHIHLPHVRSMRERWPGLARDMWAVQAGTSVSTRTRRGTRNSVHLICPSAARTWPAVDSPPALQSDMPPMSACRVEQWDFHPETQAFERVRMTHVPLDRPGVARAP